jgi:hypothetical protein
MPIGLCLDLPTPILFLLSFRYRIWLLAHVPANAKSNECEGAIAIVQVLDPIGVLDNIVRQCL